MQLIEALLGTPQEKEFKYGQMKFTLKTLSQNEINEIMERLPRMDLSIVELQKVPILARSLVNINDIDIRAFQEIRDAIKENEKVDVVSVIEKILGKMDTTLINILYGYYTSLNEEISKKREELKNI
jgi:hypothetical protein